MAFYIHAGGAASRPLLEPCSQGYLLFKDVLTRFSKLDITQIGSLVAIAGVLPSAWRFLRHAWDETYSWVRHCFLASVTIPGGDPLNRSVVEWILANRPRNYRSFTGLTEVGNSGMDRAAALKKTRHPIRNAFLVERSSDSHSIAMSNNPGYDGIGGEELTISCFGWSVEPVKRFIKACRDYTETQTQFFVIIYSRDRYGLAWQPKARKPIRHLDTVHFDNQLKQDLLADIRNYLDPKTQKRYQTRSMPYRRGYLFYGPPGTGKSSLSLAIAGEFGLDLYEVKIPSVATDADLEQMFQDIPPRCVVLLEDIDAVWVDRSNSSKPVQDGQPMPNCTLSGLLNVLDGVGSQEGRIVIMTTNRPEALDSALTRPGRIDMKVYLGNISQKSSEEMFLRMFSPDLGFKFSFDMDEMRDLATSFASQIPDDKITPSALQGFFQQHLDSPHDAVSLIGGWVKEELAKKSDKEFEVIINNENAV
ncbi:metalloprotease m41 ftsh, putative [Talaromyces stipitatus ATCC 10500]|uniref:Metalloprotease m41 ftsh, putative n=1 Tax=Talaromyces stipitatus (strain ATCC 10500 / CBS 375.48 / QM 6759 / NRRL 1006) TaxID=441959 RepID=B8MB30_TALSN|nr:metalloprotease m41 ftsh, putative [Talaromyces stipitatus ATCC 10500]EED18731.1 metalloprotease m41 ftsh, putative [Talaromyces stipitatus ATCC 10500]